VNSHRDSNSFELSSPELVLGTVQFGLNYGVTNAKGQVPFLEVEKILSQAKAKGVDALDTAMAYGDSESILGQVGVHGFRVISKIQIPEQKLSKMQDRSAIRDWLEDQVSRSLERLGVTKLEAFLFHDIAPLLHTHKDVWIEGMESLRARGFVGKVGVSIYDFDDLKKVLGFWDMGIIQAPYSLLDRRLVDSGCLSLLRSRGVEVHVRSSFLQGLLFLSPDDLPEKFSPWKDHWRLFQNWQQKNDILPEQACLQFQKQTEGISGCVVGVENVEQFLALESAFANEMSLDFPKMQCCDLRLINPSRWSEL
jgi:aryl-alcohol dehydrogenase-like predicted oxidoreductase